MVPNYIALLGLGVLAVTSSCQSGGAASPLALYPGSPEGNQARLQGTLEMDGSCLYISNPGGERWLAAFPSPGTSWDADTRSVQIGDKALRIGSSGGFTGGEVSSGPDAIQWVQAPGNGCDGSKIWLVTALTDT